MTSSEEKRTRQSSENFKLISELKESKKSLRKVEKNSEVYQKKLGEFNEEEKKYDQFMKGAIKINLEDCKDMKQVCRDFNDQQRELKTVRKEKEMLEDTLRNYQK